MTSERTPEVLAPAPADPFSCPVSIPTHVAQEQVAVFRHPQAERDVRLGDVIVGYEFQRARRRSIGLVVSSEGLSVRAPRWVSHADIDSALQAKARWIRNKLLEQRERALRLKQTRIEWRHGGSLPYLGEPLRLSLGAGGRAPSLQEGDERVLFVPLPEGSDEHQVAEAAKRWIKKAALALFSARVSHFAPLMGVVPGKVSLSSARTRWGSASADGSIRLHWRLMHFKPQVIDYVVVHELAHLHEMNHSPRFWAVVEAAMPGHAGARQQLRHTLLPEWE